VSPAENSKPPSSGTITTDWCLTHIRDAAHSENRRMWGSFWGGAGGQGGGETHTVWTYHATLNCQWFKVAHDRIDHPTASLPSFLAEVMILWFFRKFKNYISPTLKSISFSDIFFHILVCHFLVYVPERASVLAHARHVLTRAFVVSRFSASNII